MNDFEFITRNHWIDAPAINTEPSSAYSGSPLALHAMVVNKAIFRGNGFVSPGVKQHKAACTIGIFAWPASVCIDGRRCSLLVTRDTCNWNPHTAFTPPMLVLPYTSEELRTSGNIERGIFDNSNILSSHFFVWMLNNAWYGMRWYSQLREHGLGVNFHTSQVSTVPNRSSPRSAFHEHLLHCLKSISLLCRRSMGPYY